MIKVEDDGALVNDGYESYVGKCVELNGGSIILDSDRFTFTYSNGEDRERIGDPVKKPICFNEKYVVTIEPIDGLEGEDSYDPDRYYLHYIAQKAYQIVDADFTTEDGKKSIHISGHNGWPYGFLYNKNGEALPLRIGTCFKLISIKKFDD